MGFGGEVVDVLGRGLLLGFGVASGALFDILAIVVGLLV